MSFLLRQADHVGARVFDFFDYVRTLFFMVYLSLRSGLLEQTQGMRQVVSVISAQIYFTGWQGLPLISILALATGGIAIIQSSTQLSLLGGSSMVGNILVVVIVREVGPLLTALMVIARSGTAVASELGTMRVNREIEALEIMGIQPLSYIVFPRLVGGVISMVCLSFYFNLVALLGGFFVSRALHGMQLSFYFESLANAFAVEDVWLFLVKSVFSGLIIFVLGCYQGMSVQHSSHEVPQATARAVVHSIFAVTGFNLIVSLLSYLNQLVRLGII
jgi:phospholipid/cholesterol/gamma-HCH transport system permease protein